MSITLVYLCRGKSAGLGAAEKFISHYIKYKPGCEHDFVVVFKGWSKAQDQDKKLLKLKFRALSAKLIELDDDGYDWAAYMRVTVMLETEFICFLNSFSRPLGHLWLKNIYECIKIEDVGMCGATGAYKSWRFTLPLFEFNFFSVIIYPLKVTRRIINHFSLFGYYQEKFCPHLRSNGFAIERKRFQKFVNLASIPKNKKDCYRLESGNASYSNYVLSLNQRLVLVDKSGNFYDIQDWIRSKTYCCPDQPELCIADNNTDFYDKQKVSVKRQLEFDVWGYTFDEKSLGKLE